MKHFWLGKTIGIFSLSYSYWLWDSSPQPPSHSVVAFTPRLTHHLNHSATEDVIYTCALVLDSYAVDILHVDVESKFGDFPELFNVQTKQRLYSYLQS